MNTEQERQYAKLHQEFCKKYKIDYKTADEKEKFFVDEVTRVTWAVRHGGKVGVDVRGAFEK